MHRNRTILPPQILLEEYRRLLAEEDRIEALPLVVSGNSMRPFLTHDRDTVYLSRLTRPARRGDILLYRRRNGAYVLHRVWKTGPGGCTMIGDAQSTPEPGIRDDQIVAIVTAAVCNGRRVAPGDLRWDFFEKVWVCMVPMRRAIRQIYGIVCRMKTKE